MKTATTQAINILVVEDSPTQAEQLAHALERSGYEASVAMNGKEALSRIGRRKPALVISDIVMPEMDGFALCKTIKADAELRHIPVILLTALSEPEDVLGGLACGADNFITKPFDEAHLIARIHHMLVTLELRQNSKVQVGVEIFFRGQRYFITSERQQILDLLLSTYETATLKNHQLMETRAKLESMNVDLEKRVEERTAALIKEIEVRRRAEAEIAKLNQDLEQRVTDRTRQLEAANRELEAFSYSVSHDLKAPLRVVSGFAMALAQDCADRLDDNGRHLLKNIREGALTMNRLIDELLAFSRVGRREMNVSPIDMNGLAQSVCDELKSENRDRSLRFVVDPLPSTRGDAVMMRQVLVNLVSNAVKFTKKRDTAIIELSGRVEHGENVYRVKDNGVGFDMRYAHKLFGVFQRLHPVEEFEGSGVGLAIVQRGILRHGGRVWGEGAVGQGATFYFTLPGNSDECHASMPDKKEESNGRR